MLFTFEASSDREVIQLTLVGVSFGAYTGQLGGVFFVTYLFFWLAATLATGRRFSWLTSSHAFLVEKLFKIENYDSSKDKDVMVKSIQAIENRSRIQPPTFLQQVRYFFSCCMKKEDKTWLRSKGLARVEKELDVSDYIK